MGLDSAAGGGVNAGRRVIEWLRRQQLRVDPEWSVETDGGFAWWPYRHKQTVEIVREEEGPDGEVAYHVGVRTELYRDVQESEELLMALNDQLMRRPSMSGPVFTAPGELSLCSLVRVHEEIAGWMAPILSVAAILQIHEARSLYHDEERLPSGRPATSPHPENGPRKIPDELTAAANVLVLPAGSETSRWQVGEFADAVNNHMQHPPSLGASAGGRSLTVEFPFGGESSLCEIRGDAAHPTYGNGLSIVQSFPAAVASEAEGIRLALRMNSVELSGRALGYGFGSYHYGRGILRFRTFLPNARYRRGLLPNLYYSCAGRARELSLELTGRDWTPASFDIRKGALMRAIERLAGSTQG